MSRSVKKGPFVQPRLLGRVQDMNKRNERKVAQDLVARVRDLPRLHRAHHRRLQRQEARARVRHREHGRSPTRRVRAHPHVSRARQDRRPVRRAAVGERRCAFLLPPSTCGAPPGRPASSPRRSRASRWRRPPRSCGSCRRRPRATSRACCKSATANAENNHSLVRR